MVAVAIDNLAVTYGQTKVIEGLSLRIESGQFFTLLGPSGCGKTTLLRTIAGFIAASDGRIRFGDKDVTNLPAHKRDIGMVFQDYALFPDKTIYDNVAYGLRARSIDEGQIRTKVGEALERVGLSAFPSRRPAELSGGQRQRVALARALVIRPTLLLMDEPLSNLDAKLRVQVRETIAELQREAGITTVFVTHDQEEALALSDRIGLMRQGKLEQVAAPDDIYLFPRSCYVADFVGAANTLDIRLGGAIDIGRSRVEIAGAGSVDAFAAQPLPAGPAKLIMRREDLSFVAPGNGLAGRITSRQYLGSSTHYGVTLDNGTRLNATLHGHSHAKHAVGDVVAVGIGADRALVVQE